MNRRTFLTGAAGALAMGAVTPLAWISNQRGNRQTVLSAGRTANGDHVVAAVTPDGQLLWSQPLPSRAHDIAVSPNARIAAVFERRPGKTIWLFDVEAGEPRGKIVARAADAQSTTQLNGHGVFTRDGTALWATQTSFDTRTAAPRGELVCYQFVDSGFSDKVIQRLPSGGLDPHQCLLIDGRLVAANGGYAESPEQGAGKHLLAGQPPNLSWIDPISQAVVESQILDDPALSIRHIAVGPNNAIIAATQSDHGPDNTQPLVYLMRPDQTPEALPAPQSGWESLAGYVGSVAASGHHVAATSPRGNVAVAWALDSDQPGKTHARADVSGAGFVGGEILLSTGFGQLARGVRHAEFAIRFDNHLCIV